MSSIGSIPPVLPEMAPSGGSPGQGQAGLRAASTGIPTPAVIGAAPAQVVPAASALDGAVADALGRQPGLAPLFSAARALSATPDLPPALRSALSALLATVFDGDPDPEALRAAFQRSGLFHEAAATGPSARPVDLKGALALLRVALGAFLAAEADGGRARVTGDDESSGDPAPDRAGSRPEPPRPGFPLRAEPAFRLPPGLLADPRALSRLLLEETGHADARVTLQQAASLEETRAVSAERQGGGGAVWCLDLPIAVAGGISLVALRIERDEHRRADGREQGEPSHRVDLVLDVPPLGVIEARIGLLPGRRVVVGLWCEDPETIPRLRPFMDPLADSLRAAGLDMGPVDLHLGRAPGHRPEPGAAPHRLDLKL